MNDLPVGMIGIGSMGGGMARRLLKCGIKVCVCDKSEQALSALREAGADVAATARAVADQCSVVIACLPSPAISIEVAREVAAGKSLQVYVETSTIGRAQIEAIAAILQEQGRGFLDCPISGGPLRARNGELALLVSGPESAYVTAKPVLELLGKDLFYLGSTAGLSQVAKLINNHISAAGRVAVFEGLAMGVKAGIDPAVLNQVFNAGSARNYTTTHKVESTILSGTFNYGSPLTTGLKDEALFLEEAKRFNAALWLGPRIIDLFREAAAAGYKHQDGMNLYKYVLSLDSAKFPESEA